MSDAARLARLGFGLKPTGVSYADFSLPNPSIALIQSKIADAVVDTAYASLISYAEALSGLRQSAGSWGVVKLYYSAFYSMKSLLLADGVLPFNGGKEMMLDVASGRFLNGGSSSHHWNWRSIRLTDVRNHWFSSQDSEDAYSRLRTFRESVNYTQKFTDPYLPDCLVSDFLDVTRRFRAYRDDTEFLYSYLSEHLAVAYPTKLIFELETCLKARSLSLNRERVRHAQSMWKIKDRCPLT